VTRLRGCTATVGPDYLEVGSFIALAAVTGGELLIKGARPEQHRVTASAYGKLGVRWEVRGDDILVPSGQELAVQDGLHGAVPRIHDAPWPGFPADIMSIALVVATQATGWQRGEFRQHRQSVGSADRLEPAGGRQTR
jgi:UDP-N-acetylglucosamine 1-carboxyvinyltransferase